MIAYNENGQLQEYEENDSVVECQHCGHSYLQHTVEQVPGFREVDDDICPYCNKSNGRSGDVEFYNKKMPQDQKEK